MGIRMVVNYSFMIIDILNDIHNPDTVIYDIHNADLHIDHGNHHCCVVNYSFIIIHIINDFHNTDNLMYVANSFIENDRFIRDY